MYNPIPKSNLNLIRVKLDTNKTILMQIRQQEMLQLLAECTIIVL